MANMISEIDAGSGGRARLSAGTNLACNSLTITGEWQFGSAPGSSVGHFSSGIRQ